MPSKSAKLKASGSSGSLSRNNANPVPKARPFSHRNDKRTVPPTVTAGTSSSVSESLHHLVLDLSLPSHVISDRSLFTSYTSSRRLHRTIFGSEIIIEGYGDVTSVLLLALHQSSSVSGTVGMFHRPPITSCHAQG